MHDFELTGNETGYALVVGSTAAAGTRARPAGRPVQVVPLPEPVRALRSRDRSAACGNGCKGIRGLCKKLARNVELPVIRASTLPSQLLRSRCTVVL